MNCSPIKQRQPGANPAGDHRRLAIVVVLCI
jgi:hypothetical protein